ncbi:Ankyrin repeat-containing domain protein [Rhypophila sp. PSN 637]
MLLQRHHLQPLINEPDSNGQTALMHAVQGGFEDVVLTLLDAGATVGSVRDKHGQTALHCAVLKRRRTILRYLLDKGNQNKRNDNGQDGESDRRTVMDVDVYDYEGLTPLHRAIDSGFEAGVELLLEFGANLASRIRATPQKAAARLKEKHRGGNRSRT